MNYPKNVKAGDPISAKWLNGIRYAIEDNQRETIKTRLQSGVGYRASYGAGGTTIQLDGRSRLFKREDMTDREFQIKFDVGEDMDKTTVANYEDKLKVVVFWGRIFTKKFEYVDVGTPEEWNEIKDVDSDKAEIYVYFKTDKNGTVTEAEFGTEKKENSPYIDKVMGGEYCIKLGMVKEGKITQLLQGPLEFNASGNSSDPEEEGGKPSDEWIHEFKLKIESGKPPEGPETPSSSSSSSSSPPSEGNSEVQIFWGRIIKADYSEYDVGVKGQWNKVPNSNTKNCRIYVLFDVSMEGEITKAEFKTEEREIKEFYPQDVLYSGGQEGKYCLLVGKIVEGKIQQSLHGPIPFLSRVGRTNNMLTAYKGVKGQFLDFWPIRGSNGLDIDLEREKNEETGVEEPVGIKHTLKLVADNSGIKINDPARKEGHEKYIGLETVPIVPFAVEMKKEKGPPLFPDEEVSWKYTVIVKANNGSVSYFDSDNDDYLSFWYAEDKTFDDLAEGYITLECNVKTKEFDIKPYYSAMPRWEWDGAGKPLYSRCVLARVFAGQVFQFTFFSFILSPMFLGKNAVLDLAPYASYPD